MFVDPKTFLLIHVVLSLVGMFAGLVAVGGMMAGVRFGRWIGLFLATTVLTSATGFGFPSVKLLPSHIVGALSLLVLLGAIVAIYGKRLEGGWRRIFVVLSVLALYLNVFVLLAQLFQKIPAMALLGPTPPTPPFVATQLIVLGMFVVLGWASLKGFRNLSARGA
ncbi:MAG: hypothetical protein ABL916_17765 [Burkholderiaceae bacterium]